MLIWNVGLLDFEKQFAHLYCEITSVFRVTKSPFDGNRFRVMESTVYHIYHQIKQLIRFTALLALDPFEE